MAKTTKQKLILTAKILGVCLLLLIIAAFVFRDTLLQKAITHITHKMESDYNNLTHFQYIKRHRLKRSSWIMIPLIIPFASQIYHHKVIFYYVNILATRYSNI